MTRVVRDNGGGRAGPDYGTMSLPELEAEERRQREAFREAFGDLQGRLQDGGERVSGAARRARGVLGKADELVRRHHRMVLAASVGVGVALGYRRPRVVAERPPSERNEEYVLVRRERSRPSPLRSAAAKLASLAAAEALQLATQIASERRAQQSPVVPPEPPGPADVRVDPVAGGDEDIRMNG